VRLRTLVYRVLDRAWLDVERSELREHLRWLVAVLERRPPRSGEAGDTNRKRARAVALRFGLDGDEHTLAEAAVAMKLSLERVRQLEAGGLSALRRLESEPAELARRR
jgi:DNA-directed RNA polymerase sigma subunit (sigma70/sigma32)